MTKSIFIFSIILMTNLVWSQISTVSRSTLSTGTDNQIAAVGPGGGDPIDIPIADRVRFLYDESGNQRERQICINCTANKPSGQVDDIANKNIEEIVEEDGLKFYPNPVSEDLFIEFNGIDKEKKISLVEVYSLAGQKIKRYSEVKNDSTLKIPFIELSQGMYIVNIIYNNGEVVNLKIQKK
jgi:hypothetical protein